MIVGEPVVVSRREQVGVNGHNQPVYEWVAETVDDVLVSPGARTDIPDTARPDGVVVAWTLHFPKGYAASLANARVSVRGGAAGDVVGDPQHYTEANTPTRWSLPVEVTRADG